MSVSFTLLPYVPEHADNTFLHTLSVRSDELLASQIGSIFLAFPCAVRVEYGNAECSEAAVQCVDDIHHAIDVVRGQARERGFGGTVALLTLHAEQLQVRRPLECDEHCSLLLVRLWVLCKELERVMHWEWEVALMDAVPDGICLAAVVACIPEERERFVKQLAREMLPREFVANERWCSLVEAGLWMFALFDSERAVRCFVNPREEEAMVED